MTSLDSFKCQKTLKVGGKTSSITPARREKNGLKGFPSFPIHEGAAGKLLRNETTAPSRRTTFGQLRSG